MLHMDRWKSLRTPYYMVRCGTCHKTTTRIRRDDGGYGLCTRCGTPLERVVSLAQRADAKAKAELKRWAS